MVFNRKAWDKAYSAKERRERGYHCYRAMLERCYNQKHIGYGKYGAKGITVCRRWLGKNGWKNFFADMGPRPATNYSIDRYPNPAGNYKPSNCRWATREEQWHSRQRVQHGKTTMYGKYGCRCDLCREAKRRSRLQYI